MQRDRLAPEPALSDVVRRRLAALLDEVPARRALPSPTESAPDGSPRPVGAGSPARAVPGSPPHPHGSQKSPGSPASPDPPGSGAALQRAGAASGGQVGQRAVSGSPDPPRAGPAAQWAGTSSGGQVGEPAASGSRILPPLPPARLESPGSPGSPELPGPGDSPAPRTTAGARWVRSAWEFSRQHLLAVGVVLLTGCLWAGYNVLQARSTPVPVPVPSVVASASPSPSPTPAAILVHVLGAVRRPGVVSLWEGARVQDAVAAAGGFTAEADPAELNLAAVVSDGAQLVIGSRGEPRGEVRGAPGGGGAAGGDGTVSLNTATAAELEALPGVGPVTASRIIAWREQHGRFSSVEELQEVSGIGPKTYAQLVEHVRV